MLNRERFYEEGNCELLVVKFLELSESIRGRRSIRAFQKRKIQDEDVAKLIEAASWAPSAGNIQPWIFVIVKKPDLKQKLAEAAHDQEFVAEAPMVVVVCADEKQSSMGYGARGKTLYCLQDTAAAIQNIHLTAYSLGLGTCWVGSFDEDSVRAILNVPEGLRPVAIIPVGYPDVSPRQRRRKPMSEIVRHDRF